MIYCTEQDVSWLNFPALILATFQDYLHRYTLYLVKESTGLEYLLNPLFFKWTKKHKIKDNLGINNW